LAGEHRFGRGNPGEQVNYAYHPQSALSTLHSDTNGYYYVEQTNYRRRRQPGQSHRERRHDFLRRDVFRVDERADDEVLRSLH
jgi:hypothetical protein